jgi:DNA-binding response OmpR family regulator
MKRIEIQEGDIMADPQTTKRILVIEDEPDVTRIMKMLLEKDGFSAETALGGAEGIKKIKSVKPDVILLDLLMPVVSGKDVLEYIKENKVNIPVIVVTALTSVKGVREELQQKYRVDGFVSKTYLVSDLAREVRSVLETANSVKRAPEKGKTGKK